MRFSPASLPAISIWFTEEEALATIMKSLIFRTFFLVSLCFKLSVYSAFSPQHSESTNCTNRGLYTDDEPFKRNLDTVLSEISSNTNITNGYYNFSAGDDPTRANAIALCRGDRPIDECRSCVSNATIKITKSCPKQLGAVGLYWTCMLRYSNKPIKSDDDILELPNPAKVADIDGYNEAAVNLSERLRDEAASGSSTLKLATGEIKAPPSKTIYGLAQCAPDLSKLECEDCLNRAIRRIPSCCKGNNGLRLIPSACLLWYDSYQFYSESPSPPPPSLLSPQPSLDVRIQPTRRRLIIVVVTSVAGLILIVAISAVLIFRKRKHANSTERVEGLHLRERDEDGIFTSETPQFEFAVIKAATDDFSVANKLGEGGFGPVYKGKLSNGKSIAVKRLSRNSGQGDLEFKNEVVLVGKLQHRNLVRLLGFSLQGNERLLVYEFVPNASLDQFIFELGKVRALIVSSIQIWKSYLIVDILSECIDPQRRTNLDWDRRFKIIGGIARGLLYLHEDSRLRIIHRDLKTSNILLDAEMNAKIADFGIAKLFELDETQGNTSRVVGTCGYMSPEYVLHGQFSVKSDVYSFGIIILEIVSGKKNSCFRNGERVEDILSFVWNRWREGRGSNVIDPTLTSGSQNEMMRCINIGLLCVQEDPGRRPTMASVVLMLNSFSLSLPVPAGPAFYTSSTVVEAEKTELAGSKRNSLGHSNDSSITNTDL